MGPNAMSLRSKLKSLEKAMKEQMKPTQEELVYNYISSLEGYFQDKVTAEVVIKNFEKIKN
jgi:hypothetical protein